MRAETLHFPDNPQGRLLPFSSSLVQSNLDISQIRAPNSLRTAIFQKISQQINLRFISDSFVCLYDQFLPLIWQLVFSLYIKQNQMQQQATMSPDCMKARMTHRAQLFCNNHQFQQAEEIADQLFKLKYLTQAIDIYQMIIENTIQIEQDCHFEGLGNAEQQTGYYEWNIAEWYISKKQAKQMKGSPYDGLSLCYSVRKSSINGEGWYRQMIGKHPNNHKLLFGLANILYTTKCLEQCIKLYEQVIDIRPDFVSPYVNLAFLFQFQRREKINSLRWAEKALEIDPNNIYAHFIKARNILDVDQKIKRFKELNAICPKYLRIIQDIGITYSDTMKKYEDAIEWHKKCLQINPLQKSASLYVGINYRILQQYETAKNWFYLAIQCDPEYREAHKNLTYIYDRQKTSQQDILIESKVHKVNQEQFCYEFGRSYYDKNAFDLSITWFLKAIQINPNSHKYFNALAISYDEKKNYDKAIQCYKKCIDINPLHFNAYYNLAITYKNKGSIEDTITCYMKCIELNPKDTYSYNNLGNIYQDKRQYKTAINFYQKAIEYLSTYTLAITNMGICYQQLKNYWKAISCFKRATELLLVDNSIQSNGNKQFLNRQLKQYQVETAQLKKTGIMSISYQGMKNQMVEQFGRGSNNLYFQINREITQEEKSTEESQSIRSAEESSVSNQIVP